MSRVSANIRNHQRAINKALRDLEKVQRQMKVDDAKMAQKIRDYVANGEMKSARILAKSLVQNRNFQRKFVLLRASMQAASLKIATVSSQWAVSLALRDITLAMKKINTSLNIPQMSRILQQFEKNTEIMNMKEESISAALSNSHDEDDDADQYVNQVLDELGLDTIDSSPKEDKPQEKEIPIKEPEPSTSSAIDEQIQFRLGRLRE